MANKLRSQVTAPSDEVEEEVIDKPISRTKEKPVVKKEKKENEARPKRELDARFVKILGLLLL